MNEHDIRRVDRQTRRACVRSSSAAWVVIGLIWICGADAGLQACQADEVTGLNRDLSVRQYEYRGWTMQHGLPSDRVQDIVQTPDGYLWVATDRGLARFDGIRFTVFNRANTPAFSTNQITSLYLSHDASLWIGTRRGGLLRYRCESEPAFTCFAALENYTIRSLCEDSDGVLWIGTDRQTWTLRDEELTCRSDAPVNVNAICVDSGGTLWLGAGVVLTATEELSSERIRRDPGLYRFQNDEFKKLTEADGYPYTTGSASVLGLASDGRGGLWVGQLGHAPVHYCDGTSQELPQSAGRQCVAMLVDRSQHLWYSSRERGVHRVRGDKTERLPLKHLLSYTTCITQDREGHIWLGGVGGLRRIKNPALETVDLGAGSVGATCVLEDSQGRFWIGSGSRTPRGFKGGLYLSEEAALTQLDISGDLPCPYVSCLSGAPDGSLWIGTAKGIARLQDGEIIPVSAKAMPKSWIRSLYVDRSGDAWVGFDNGGFGRIRDEAFEQVREFGEAVVNWIHQYDDDVVWIGSTRGLYTWREDQLQRVQNEITDALPTNSFLTGWVDQQGHRWFGTDGGGLCRLADGEFSNWTSENGLHEDVISAIIEDSHGQLWLGGPHGLTTVPKAQFQSESPVRLNVLVRGADHTQMLGSGQSNASRRRDNSLYFVTTNGAVTVPADGPHQNRTAPMVHVEEVRVDGSAVDFRSGLELSSGARRVEFQYTANTFATPEKVRFRYRMDGHDDRWIEGGNVRQAGYTDLPPGQYNFRVKADNGEGVWSTDDVAISVNVIPQWWELVWLRVMAAVITVGLVILYVRHRLQSVRAANEDLRREIHERTKAEQESLNHQAQLARVSRAASMGELSTSIAHEIKQPLFAIVSNAQTARKLVDQTQPDIDEVREALTDIANDGNRASTIIDRIRALVKKERKPVADLDLNEVVREAAAFADGEMRRRQLQLHTELADDLPPVTGDPIELQQVILNLLFNGAQAMKETTNREILLSTRALNGDVQVAVKDHGIGISQDKLQQVFEPFFTTKPTGIGMGLAINRTIIDAHGGRIWGEKNEDQGMTFFIQIPACHRQAVSAAVANGSTINPNHSD